MPKIIILNQCTIDPSYKDVDEAMRSTWQSIKHPYAIHDGHPLSPALTVEPITVINYYGSESLKDKQCTYSADTNTLIINIEDDSQEEKFILALEYCLNNFEFDYIYKTSCTSYIDVIKMYDHISSLSKENVCNGCKNTYDDFNVIMSRDIVEQIINNKSKFIELNFDDQDQSSTHVMINGDILNHSSLLHHSSSIFNFKFEKTFSNNFEKIHNFLKNNSLKYFYYDSLDKGPTDKGNVHDYINAYYGNEFVDRSKKIKLVEIGVSSGASIRLWRDWFTNAEIFGFDILKDIYPNYEINIEGTTIVYQDGYSNESANMFEDESLDYVIDDGPHNLQSQITAIIQYLPKLKKGGKIIIEDISYVEWEKEFIKLIEENSLNVSYKFYDLRQNKGRFDDMIFEITKK